MPTDKQLLGSRGEDLVTRNCRCPKCKRQGTLRRLPVNFKCADVICDFCGYLAQVKALSAKSVDAVPDYILGAGWGPQEARMVSGIYFPLFIVLVVGRQFGIHYLSADAQVPEMFLPRKPLSQTARRAGWQGFVYDLRRVRAAVIRVL